jgi:hypothetical protein
MPEILLPRHILNLFPDKLFPKHLKFAEKLCLELLKSKDFNRLVIEWPIGHGKS